MLTFVEPFPLELLICESDSWIPFSNDSWQVVLSDHSTADSEVTTFCKATALQNKEYLWGNDQRTNQPSGRTYLVTSTSSTISHDKIVAHVAIWKQRKRISSQRQRKANEPSLLFDKNIFWCDGEWCIRQIYFIIGKRQSLRERLYMQYTVQHIWPAQYCTCTVFTVLVQSKYRNEKSYYLYLYL